MSCDSNRESPRNDNCSGVSQHQSISDVVLSEGQSCFDIDYKAVVKELKDREEVLLKEKEEIVVSLRERNDILEADLGDWKIKYCVMEEECCRWKRDYYEKDDLLRESRREVKWAKKKERDLDRKLLELGVEVDELKLKIKENEEMNEVLERKKAEFHAQLLEKLKVEKMEELCEDYKDKNNQLKNQVKARWDEFEGMRGSNPYLEECKAEYVRVKELKKSDEEKDEKIRKLVDEVDRLQGEKIEIKKDKDDLVDKLQREKIKIEKERDKDIEKLKYEKEGLSIKNMMLEANLVKVNELVSKLEGDMFTFMCKDLEGDANFANAPVGKVFSGIIKALDAGVAKDGIHQEAGDLKREYPGPAMSVKSRIWSHNDTVYAAFVACINEPKCSLKPGKQSLAATERLKRKLDFETETLRDGVDAGSKRPTSADPIIIDSDDENAVKDKGRCLGSLLEQRRHLNKIKKLNVLCEQVKQGTTHAVLSASRSDHALNTSQKQKSASLKKYIEKHGRVDRVPLSNGNDSEPLSPRAKELQTSFQQRLHNNKLKYDIYSKKIKNLEYDIVCAFEQDDRLCAEAVCALYRLQKSVLSGVNGLICLGSKGLEECDIGSVSALAKFLIDGDPNGKMKKSLDQLRQEDLAECRRFAVKYSEQLSDMFRKNEDPQFSPVSNSMICSTSFIDRILSFLLGLG